MSVYAESLRRDSEYVGDVIEQAADMIDLMERAMRRSRQLLHAAGVEISENGYGMDFTHVDGIETDNIGFGIDCENNVSLLDDIINKLETTEPT